MKNKTISIPEDIFDKLSHEDNASLLITQLLIGHYETSDVEVLKQTITKQVLDMEKIKVWGKEIRKVHAKEGRDTDDKISEWMTGATFQLQDKWAALLKWESENGNTDS